MATVETPHFAEAMERLKVENARACESDTTRLGLALVAEVERLQAEVVRLQSKPVPITKRLRDCRGFVETINELCSCGGNGPELGCLACKVFHAIADWEVVGP